MLGLCSGRNILDPSHLTDQYADYWALTQNHSKIINQYCIANPKQWKIL
jgi:hypothetical protein